MSSPQNIAVDQVKVILNEIIASLATPENSKRLEEGKETAGNEMLKMMQVVFPLVVELQIEVIKKHGFAAGREGIVQFSQLVREMERVDGDIAKLHAQIRGHYMPPVAIVSNVEAIL